MENKELIFLRVVEAGSLRAAAEQLGADPSSVSRKVAALEGRLGVKLLQRSTKRTEPTEVGRTYYEGLRRLADEQAALEASISKAMDRPQGALRVAAPVNFGTRFVAPVLQAMYEDYPALTVELRLGSTFEDLGAQGIDVAIRVGRLSDSSLTCRRLGLVPRVLVASKGYVKRRGLPERPKDLGDHDFIFYNRSSAQSPIELSDDEGSYSVPVGGRFIVNSITSIQALVEEGQGIHMGPYWAFRDGLADGRLVEILPDYRMEAFPVHALYSSTAFVPAKIRLFIDRMVAQAADHSNKGWDRE